MPDPVRAAGAVLHRPAGDVCLVHRPRYDDWSLPKGKLHPSEHPISAAVREVAEETGAVGVPELRLPRAEYTMPDGRAKTVDFWSMRTVSEGPVGDADEVDEIAWLPPAEAAARLTYDDERAVLRHFAALPPVTSAVVVVRHAHAGDRKSWVGRDALRPLDEMGQTQADRLGAVLKLLEPRRMYAATPLRCRQTLEPLAAALGGAPIVQDAAFAEPAERDDAEPDRGGKPQRSSMTAKAKLAAQHLLELRESGVTVVCSQGKVIPTLIATLRDEDDPKPYKTPKGTGWLLTWSADRLLGASRV